MFSLTIKRMAIGRGRSNIGTLRHRLRSSQSAPSRWLARACRRDRFRNDSHPSARPFCAAVAANHSKASRGGRTSIDLSRIGSVSRGGTPLNSINRRNRARCPTCGVVESMRKIECQSDVGGQYIADIKVARGVTGGASGSAIAANAVTGTRYEITVRFRDGSTTVFNEANARTWQLGSRVMVIGRSSVASNN